MEEENFEINYDRLVINSQEIDEVLEIENLLFEDLLYVTDEYTNNIEELQEDSENTETNLLVELIQNQHINDITASDTLAIQSNNTDSLLDELSQTITPDF